MAATEVTVPDIGDFKDVPVIELLVKAGDAVKKDDSLLVLQSDKATLEVPSPAAGVVSEMKVKVGDKVSAGTLLALLEGGAPGTNGDSKAKAPASAPAPEKTPAPAAPAKAAAPATAPAPAPAAAPAAAAPAPAESGAMAHASPGVRRFARELGVTINQVTGTGPKGRISKEDIQAFVKQSFAGGGKTGAGGMAGLGLPPWPKVDFAKYGPIETQALTRIQKLSGPGLARNWVMIPHVTQFDEADITELEKFRSHINEENAKSGVKASPLAFIMKAVVAALKKYPTVNSSLDGEQLVLKQYYNIGFAADTPNGLVVPVLKDADRKGILQISAEMGELAKKARDGKLGSADMQGGCLSISSLGGIGGTHFTPIINAPEVAILGLSRGQMKPVWDGKQFVPRLVLPLSLSYDHRVIDGASAARFNAYLGQVLADFRRVLL